VYVLVRVVKYLSKRWQDPSYDQCCYLCTFSSEVTAEIVESAFVLSKYLIKLNGESDDFNSSVLKMLCSIKRQKHSDSGASILTEFCCGNGGNIP
jgi:hypothetical protein